MNSWDWEDFGFTLVFSLGVIAVATVLSIAFIFSALHPNHTAVACIEAGFELIEGNCLSP